MSENIPDTATEGRTMPEGNQGNSSQGQESGAATQGQGQESASNTGAQGQESGAQQGGANGPADITKMSEAELRTYAATLQKDAGQTREEAARYRTELTEARGKLTEAERAQLSEQEKVQADLTASTTRVQELETQLRDLTVGAAVRDALNSSGAFNPAIAMRALGEVEADKDGQPKADKLQAAITKLKTDEPYLFKRGANADAGAGRQTPPEGGSSINDLIRGTRPGR